MGGEKRFEVVACRRAHEISALRSEQVSNGAGVIAPDRFASENDRAGVDVTRAEAGLLVGGIDETPQRLIVDAFTARTVGCQMDRRQVERVAFGNDEAAGQFSAESAQDKLRKNDLRGRGADIDPDARERDRIELPERMFFLYVEPMLVVVMIVGKIVHGKFHASEG